MKRVYNPFMSSLAPRESERRAGLAAVAGFAVLSVSFTGFFPPFGNPNEISRLETVYAFVEQGTFSIDGAIPVLGNHEDKAVSGGRFYSNKAPGLTFAAIPVYRALRIFFPAPKSPWDAVFVLVRVLTVSLLFALALARFVARLQPGKGAGLVVFAVTFGTPLLFYGRSFFGHAWTAALLFLAWDLLRTSEERPPVSGTLLLAGAAGLLAGWAAISEYTAAPIALLFCVLRAAARGSWRGFRSWPPAPRSRSCCCSMLTRDVFRLAVGSPRRGRPTPASQRSPERASSDSVCPPLGSRGTTCSIRREDSFSFLPSCSGLSRASSPGGEAGKTARTASSLSPRSPDCFSS
jgi:hypothetical protein